MTYAQFIASIKKFGWERMKMYGEVWECPKDEFASYRAFVKDGAVILGYDLNGTIFNIHDEAITFLASEMIISILGWKQRGENNG